jgi:streptomycin 6-kinase
MSRARACARAHTHTHTPPPPPPPPPPPLSAWFAGFTDREVQVLSIDSSGDVEVVKEYESVSSASLREDT